MTEASPFVRQGTIPQYRSSVRSPFRRTKSMRVTFNTQVSFNDEPPPVPPVKTAIVRLRKPAVAPPILNLPDDDDDEQPIIRSSDRIVPKLSVKNTAVSTKISNRRRIVRRPTSHVTNNEDMKNLFCLRSPRNPDEDEGKPTSPIPSNSLITRPLPPASLSPEALSPSYSSNESRLKHLSLKYRRPSDEEEKPATRKPAPSRIPVPIRIGASSEGKVLGLKSMFERRQISSNHNSQ